MKFKDKPSCTDETYCRAETYYCKTNKDDITPGEVYRNTTLYDKLDNIVLMTEKQLKNIVDRMGKESTTGTDGDEFTIKDGITASKFSKEAMYTTNLLAMLERIQYSQLKMVLQRF